MRVQDEVMVKVDAGVGPIAGRETDILVVGAGPTGLTLAVELARRGVPFLLIERLQERPPTSRALGTQTRTIEVFRLMGIPEEALAPAVRPRAFRLAEGERTLARLPMNTGASGALPLLVMNEADTERVLEERLDQLGGHVTRGVDLLGYRLEGGWVRSTLQGPAGVGEVRSRYLVGADGAHSIVRRDAGIAFAGADYPERFLLADVVIDWDLPHDEGQIWIGDGGLAAVIPLPGERLYRLIVPLSANETAMDLPSEAAIAERAEAVLLQRTGVRVRRIGDPIWASAFRISRRQAAHYRKGPVFLAGDAAHVHSPVGAQGMNTGIQDAFNLGWKLALAVRGEAAPGLLGTYEAERSPIARDVLRGTDLGMRLMVSRGALAQAIREYLVPPLVSLAPVRRRLTAAIAQLQVNYRGAFLSVDADPAREGLRAGDRVPDVALVAWPDEAPVSLFDLIAGGWLLLLSAGSAPDAASIAALEARARETRQIVGEAVRPFLVVDSAPESAPALPALIDRGGAVASTFSPRSGLVVLIRPDGYLGYRGSPHEAGALASYLARVFAMRMGRKVAGSAR
jgi:2-polyprenyl-6-methoxyphenol hydroxylase-like FAD-dependent oxidoreductase